MPSGRNVVVIAGRHARAETTRPAGHAGRMQSLELLLDAATDDRVRRAWARLADAGLPSQADHRGASNAPHVTLLAAGGIRIPAAAEGVPLPILLGSPVLLGGGERRTLALGVVPSRALLDLHAALWETLRPEDPAPHSAPGRWTPHVTLARRLPVGELGRAFEALGDLSDSEATAVALRHWDPATRRVTPVPAPS